MNLSMSSPSFSAAEVRRASEILSVKKKKKNVSAPRKARAREAFARGTSLKGRDCSKSNLYNENVIQQLISYVTKRYLSMSVSDEQNQ